MPPGGWYSPAMIGVPHGAGHVQIRDELLNLLGKDDPRVDAHQPVGVGPLHQPGDAALVVRHRQVAMLREHHVEVELFRQLFVQLDRQVVERDALRRAIVGPHNRRVAAGAAESDVLRLQDGDVLHAKLREVVRGRQAMNAAADDDDVVAVLQFVLAPHPQRAHGTSFVPAGRKAELGAGVQQDLPEVLGRVAADMQIEPVGEAAEQRVDAEHRTLAAAADGEGLFAEIDGRDFVENPFGIGSDEADRGPAAGDVDGVAGTAGQAGSGTRNDYDCAERRQAIDVSSVRRMNPSHWNVLTAQGGQRSTGVRAVDFERRTLRTITQQIRTAGRASSGTPWIPRGRLPAVDDLQRGAGAARATRPTACGQWVYLWACWSQVRLLPDGVGIQYVTRERDLHDLFSVNSVSSVAILPIRAFDIRSFRHSHAPLLALRFPSALQSLSGGVVERFVVNDRAHEPAVDLDVDAVAVLRLCGRRPREADRRPGRR